MQPPLHLILNTQDTTQLADTLHQCCASENWVSKMIDSRPFTDTESVFARSANIWATLDEGDYLQAFSAHPQIGDIKTLQTKYANTREFASTEQAKVAQASHETIEHLALANQLYQNRFGFMFIICVTGKSAQEMLEALHLRSNHSTQDEIRIAAAEQLKITTLRLMKITNVGSQ